jgi:hypothetical protein
MFKHKLCIVDLVSEQWHCVDIGCIADVSEMYTVFISKENVETVGVYLKRDGGES